MKISNGTKFDLPSLRKAGGLKGKRVIVRLDLNVPIADGKILDETRLRKSLPTLFHLQKEGARIVAISHLGEDGAQSLEEVAKHLSRLVPLTFLPKMIGREAEEAVAALPEGEILLLENLRRESGEKENNTFFALTLSRLGDVYVNEAFSSSHRKHASIVSLPKFLQSYAGLQFEEEVKELSKTFAPKHPFLFILGGAKFSTKLPLIEKYLEIAERVYVGGALMNSFFKSKGFEIGRSVAEGAGEELLRLIKNKKLVLPSDVTVEGGEVRAVTEVRKNDIIRDIGPASLEKLKSLIEESKEILFNGPLGNYELGFVRTTEETLRAMGKTKARSVVGGGDTIALVSRFNLEKEFSFVSTAGGAMIEFLSKGTLPGIEALRKGGKEKNN